MDIGDQVVYDLKGLVESNIAEDVEGAKSLRHKVGIGVVVEKSCYSGMVIVMWTSEDEKHGEDVCNLRTLD